MDALLQKAAKGNRTALTQLYESNKDTIYFLCSSLLRSADTAIGAANWAIKSALQALPREEMQTEADFTAYAVKQAASYCKKEVLKKDSRAFKLPPKKDFHLVQVNESAIDPEAETAEHYITGLPAIQRFVLVLRIVGEMPVNQIAKAVGLETATVNLIIEAEPENLGKIYRAVKSKAIKCTAPTNELLKKAFTDALARTAVPEEVTTYVHSYIESVAGPIEAAAKNKRKKAVAFLISACAVCVLILAVVIIFVTQSGNSGTTTNDDGTSSTTSSSVSDTDGDDSTDATDDASASAELDPSLIYYADIVIKDYGTITVQLDQASAPITAANFVNLAESGFYDGLTIHRIVENFLIQGGDPNGDGTGGSDETIVGEFTANGYDNNLSHTRGAISMARSDDYNSASSQFFIVHADSTSLDGEYAVFGYVTEGMDVVDAICEDAEPVDSFGYISAKDQPVITSVTIRKEETK